MSLIAPHNHARFQAKRYLNDYVNDYLNFFGCQDPSIRRGFTGQILEISDYLAALPAQESATSTNTQAFAPALRPE
ncbi:hypothetical protein [Cypionkella sp.]|uniref:hypothetical protein n=1 Tax=Cypionkella sp. TaxID=2811411 RepID=UPI00271E4976|nr:hypothetical protein [Cypionkella sp.]MDO8982569.1 hypothetical protein [Cypionkella sp.]MDP2051420.1 hypothetical protein [Cypionkella sp.]